jgi:hypothetical protein
MYYLLTFEGILCPGRNRQRLSGPGKHSLSWERADFLETRAEVVLSPVYCFINKVSLCSLALDLSFRIDGVLVAHAWACPQVLHTASINQ